MAKITVYRFDTWDAGADGYIRSRRWATREAVQRLSGSSGRVDEQTATEIDDSALGQEIEGMTDRNYNPNPRNGFQTRIGE